jgi:Peptidase S8 pro-domain
MFFSVSFFSFQIGSLKGYYLFHHKHVVKRSVNRNELHHNALNSEPEVSVQAKRNFILYF